MFKWLAIIAATMRSTLHRQRDLAVENLVLRQQLAILKQRNPRPRLTDTDRLFGYCSPEKWSGWRDTLHIVKPETVVRWHRQGLRYYWRWISRHRGRPKVDPGIRELIRRMCQANPLRGAPRIHGELLNLGIEVSETTVSKYMIRHREPPSLTWRTFLQNQAKELIALDFFTVPTATFRVLFVFAILSHDRRRILHFNVTEHPTAAWTAEQLLEACETNDAPLFLVRDRDAIYGETFRHQVASLKIQEILTAPRSPWQNPYVERVIGSIPRECSNHIIVLGERHLRRIISSYVRY